MAIYEVRTDSIEPLQPTHFASAGIRERDDLQRLLRDNIAVIGEDLLVIGEEFCDWEDSRRRIDLLAVDAQGNLVVIELKRTDNGGHMELQAIRYAAMVSAMTFDKAVEVFAAHLQRTNQEGDAQDRLLSFLGWEEPDEDSFAQDIRILLVSEGFSKELTTSVMWLNERELDIRCVRLRPYSDGGRVLVDVQQLIPLPEAQEFQVQIREKESRSRESRKKQSVRSETYQRFWAQLLEKAKAKTDLHKSISPGKDNWVAATAGVPGVQFVYVLGRNCPRVELYISTGDKGRNKDIFDSIERHKDKIETACGDTLSWERMDDRVTCRIANQMPTINFQDETTWGKVQDDFVDAMVRFEGALRPVLAGLK
ncbi:MAG: DUF4268 domain-containing protein [Verrucomicrobia bacterium]|jgi:hypothetical protein|nr:DUF4268 domain-containing protein [Verrucomicrobiota bacterium]